MSEINNNSEEKEIDLLELANKLWLKKKFIIKASLIGLVIGIIIAFSIPKEYSAIVILTPESNSNSPSMGNAGALAALAGINLNMGGASSDALASPAIYPDVMKSTPFVKGLFNIKVTDNKNNIDTTLYSYLLNAQRRPWWSYIKDIPSLFLNIFSSSNEVIEANNDISKLSSQDLGIIANLNNRLSIDTDKKTGVITVGVTMQSAEISAYIADTLTSYLQSYIIDYRTQKSRQDLVYAEKLYEEAQQNYFKTQQNLAVYLDGNMNVISARYKITQERLQNESDLAYSIYNQTAQQMQLAKIKVQNTTPVFTIIQPAIEPLYPSQPNKKIIIIGFILATFIGVCVWIIGKDILVSFREGKFKD